MSSRLTDNLNSLYLGAANSLKPKKARKKVVAYVESYDDILFWRSILAAYENDQRYFEIMLPSRDSLTKGKKQALMNTLGETLGQNMIACVDADYDYLLQGTSETSKRLCESPYVFHTYAYAIENYQCNASCLHEVCVMATLNDRQVLDFNRFLQLYSQIAYPLLVWNVYFYRQGDLHSFSMQDFNRVVRVERFDIQKPGDCLLRMQRRVTGKLNELRHDHKGLKDQLAALEEEMIRLGVRPDNAYYFIRGHHVFEHVVMPVLTPICIMLRKEREDEIQHLADHEAQMKNELNCYQHSQCSVDSVLKKNIGIQKCEPFSRLKQDLDDFFLKN